MCNPSRVMNTKMNYSMMCMCSRKSTNEYVDNKSMNSLGKKGEKHAEGTPCHYCIKWIFETFTQLSSEQIELAQHASQ